MGVSQKAWNRRARVAARKAVAKARKQGASKTKIWAAYRNAYSKIRLQSPAGKAVARKYRQSPAGKAVVRKYRRSPAAKASMKKWRQSPAGKASKRRYSQSLAGKAVVRKYSQSPAGKADLQTASSRHFLKQALGLKGPLQNGWPDSGREEMKIGSDNVRAEQWRRAAQYAAKGIIFNLRFAATHEDALHDDKCKIISFEDYAKQLGMFKEWSELVRKTKSL